MRHGNGLSLSIPSPLHIIAMKLHALRSPASFAKALPCKMVKH